MCSTSQNKTCDKPTDFPDRIVLGEGFPWANGTGPYFEIGLRDVQVGGRNLQIFWPDELWSKTLPRYRLVLEKIPEDVDSSSSSAMSVCEENRQPKGRDDEGTSSQHSQA